MNKFKFMTTALAMSVLITGGSVSVRAASTQEQIEAVQKGKARSESDLAETQERIASLEGQRGDLESYLSQLSQQYEGLSASLEELTEKAKQKQEELKMVKRELKKAKEKEQEQYENMKIRISYMYENSKGNLLTSLLAVDSFTDFLTRAENFKQISAYDREMLEKYEQTKEKVQDQKTAIKVEQESIIQLQAESAKKRQEVEGLAASTQEEISLYAQEIDRAEGEAASLLELVESQSAELGSLMEKAEEEAEAARRAAEAALAKQQEEAEMAAAQKAAKETEQAQEDEKASQGTDVQEGDGQDGLSEALADTGEEADIEAEETADATVGTVGESSTPEAEGSDETPETTEAAQTPEATAVPEETTTPAAQETAGSNSAGTYLGEFTLTAYCSCSKCCGSWSGGGTASGTVPTAGRTVAMGGLPFGTKLLINGNVYTVEDRGTGYGHVDIYMDSHSAALQFGSQKAAVYQLNE